MPADAAATCWDGRDVRAAAPLHGSVARGTCPTVRLLFRNGRELRCTPDHEIRTPLGWRAAGSLRPADRIACLPYVGLPYEAPSGLIAFDVPGNAGVKLEALGLAPLHAADARLPALLRVLGVVCGDGHLSRDGKAVSIHTVVAQDAVSIAADLTALGVSPVDLHPPARPATPR